MSSNRSVCNTFGLSRQNSIHSHRTLTSAGSGTPKEDYKPNNLNDVPEVKVTGDKDALEEEDPDAIDEAVSLPDNYFQLTSLCLGSMPRGAHMRTCSTH